MPVVSSSAFAKICLHMQATMEGVGQSIEGFRNMQSRLWTGSQVGYRAKRKSGKKSASRARTRVENKGGGSAFVLLLVRARLAIFFLPHPHHGAYSWATCNQANFSRENTEKFVWSPFRVLVIALIPELNHSLWSFVYIYPWSNSRTEIGVPGSCNSECQKLPPEDCRQRWRRILTGVRREAGSCMYPNASLSSSCENKCC